MATIVTRSGKGSALTFAEMDANFTNLNNELANVSLGVLPENSISATELQDTGDFTMNSLVTTAGITVGGSILPTANNAVDLGSPTKMFRDLYVGPGSLYVNGVKVLESNADTLSFTTDVASDQEIFINPDGDLRLGSTQGNIIVQGANRLEVETITGPAGGTITNDINALSFTAGVGTSLTATKLSKPSGNFEIETATGGGEYIHLETNDVYLGSFSGAVKVSDGLITTASGALDIQAGGTSNISISPPSANSEGYSTATLDSSSGHFFLKSGLVLDHPGTAGLEAKYSNYITVATTDGDLNMSSNGGGRIRPRSDFQIRGSDGCDLWLRSEFSTDAKMSFRGGSTEQGALIVDRNNSEVRYYTDSWDQVFQSDQGQTRILNYGGNVEIRSRDTNNSSKGNVIVRADNKMELQAGDDQDSKGDLLLTSFDDFQFRKQAYASTDTDVAPTTNSSTTVTLSRSLTTGETNALNDGSLYFYDSTDFSNTTSGLRNMDNYIYVESVSGSGASTELTLEQAVSNLSDTTHSAGRYLQFYSKQPHVVVDSTRGRHGDFGSLKIQNRLGYEGPADRNLVWEAIDFGDSGNYIGTETSEQVPVRYQMGIFKDSNQLKLSHSSVVSGSQTDTDVMEVRGRTTTSSTIGSTTTPEVVEFHLNPQVQSYTKAELDAITGRTGEIAMCSNGNAGAPCLAFYSGSAWLNASGAALSTT